LDEDVPNLNRRAPFYTNCFGVRPAYMRFAIPLNVKVKCKYSKIGVKV
jgi:hypothetical protein